MPVTRSEILFFCGGAVVGALGAKNIDKIKTSAAPWLAKAAEAAGDAYTAAARTVGERLEAVQDAMAKARRNGEPAEANGQASRGPSATAANGTQG